MGLEYLKITPEIMLKISAYDQEQQGRLVMAMIAYALTGEEPQFDGVEKFVWPTLKQDVDNCSAHVEKQKANGSRGGRPPKHENQDKLNENPTKPNETQSKPNESLNTNTNTNTNTNSKKEDDVVSAHTRATATAAPDEPVIAFDGSDMTEYIRRNEEADVLIRQYGMKERDREFLLADIEKYGIDKVSASLALISQYGINPNARSGLLTEIEKHGIEKIRRVTQDASEADKMNGLSLNYIRAFLANDGKPKGKDGDRLLRYTKDERKATYSAAIVNFDDED